MALEKARIINTATDDEFVVFLNPEDYSLTRDNAFAQAAVPGRQSPLLQFTHGNVRILEMELFFDTYETRTDVRLKTEPLIRLLDIDPDTHAPPVLLVVWGTLEFQCVLVKANQRFILFLTSGIPVRARVQTTFNEFTNGEIEAKEKKRETANYTKVHIVKRGETLSDIAGRVYANPLLWRPLALRNAIEDPIALTPGLQLAVPRLPFTDPDTGEVFR
jgi:hypothetical protein